MIGPVQVFIGAAVLGAIVDGARGALLGLGAAYVFHRTPGAYEVFDPSTCPPGWEALGNGWCRGRRPWDPPSSPAMDVRSSIAWDWHSNGRGF